MSAIPPHAGIRRVLMTADTVGGVWHYAMTLIGELGRAGVAVDLVTFGGPPDAAQRASAAALDGCTLHVTDAPCEWMQEPWPALERLGEQLLALDRRLQPDLVHLNHYCHGDLPWSAPRLIVGHSCVRSWCEAAGEPPGAPPWDRYAERVRTGLQAADLVVTPTAAMGRALAAHYGPLPPRRVIANGVPAVEAPSAPKQPTVLAAGRLWDRAKNLALLDAAAAGLPWPVQLAGATNHPEGGQVHARHVALLGRLTPADLHARYAQAAIFALPSRYEPFGLAAVEAALAGCALVLGDIPSLREVWGEAADYAAVDDAAALRARLDALIADPAHRAERARAAQAHAQRYLAPVMAAEYLACYRDLVAGRRAPQAEAAA